MGKRLFKQCTQERFERMLSGNNWNLYVKNAPNFRETKYVRNRKTYAVKSEFSTGSVRYFILEEDSH